MNEAVIRGTYTNLRNIKTRNVVVIEVEVPVEEASNVVAKLGFPNQGQPQPVFVILSNE
jgi:hypothetical protein